MDAYNLVSLAGLFVVVLVGWLLSIERRRVNWRTVGCGVGLQMALAAGAFTHPRSPVIVAYALCGFAHVASLAIFVGGLAALVPERRTALARMGPWALLAATLACLMTGAVAGVFFHGGAMVMNQ